MSLTLNFDDLYSFENFSSSPHTYVPNPDFLACEIKQLDSTVSVTLSVILYGIFLLAIPGNLLVGWVITTSRQALTPSDMYLFHLTIADGLMALTLPFFATALMRGWIFGDFLCKLLYLVLDANFYTSIIFLACISIDRYLVIVHAREMLGSRKRRCSRLLCGAVWALGGALGLPALFNEVSELDDGKTICSESFDLGDSASWRLATRALLHICGYLVPLVVMLACYGITIVRLLHTRGFQKHRAMRVIIAVVVAFLLCWTPYHITMVVDTLLRADLIPKDCNLRSSVSVALVVTNCLALLHSCINPFVYAFIGAKFRKNMMQFFQRKLRRQERMSGSKFSRSTSQSSDGNGTFL